MKKVYSVMILIASIIVLAGCSTTKAGVRIDFGNVADASNQSNYEIKYDLKEIKSQMEKYLKHHKVYVFSDPKKTDYSIAEKFGFDISEYVESRNKRTYRIMEEDGLKLLQIDEYGNFSFQNGEKETYFNYPFSEEECVEIAKEYLKKYGLIDDKMSGSEWSINYTTIESSEEDSTVLTERDVVFHRDLIEDAEVYGLSQIIVYINGYGNVRRISYQMHDYGKKTKIKPIDVEKVIKNLKIGENCFLDTEGYGTNLKITDVSLAYYAEDYNNDNLFIQPIYIFDGTCEENGQEVPFSIFAQANETDNNYSK